MDVIFYIFFYLLFYFNMEEKTREDLVQYFKDSDFVFTEYWDYECNVKAMSDAVQFMWWNRYIEEMQPALSDDCWYAVADYYDDIVKDVIVFDTEIHWNFQMSPEEVADYLIMMNDRYEEIKKNYESMYTVSECFKKIFRLFTN